jgi:hypothetical protein
MLDPNLTSKLYAVLQFMPIDLAGVAVEAHTLAGLTFAFCDFGSAGKAEVESLVTRLGGKVNPAWCKPWPASFRL